MGGWRESGRMHGPTEEAGSFEILKWKKFASVIYMVAEQTLLLLSQLSFSLILHSLDQK